MPSQANFRSLTEHRGCPTLTRTRRCISEGKVVLEFQVDRIEPNGLVIGRNGDADIPLGTVFVALKKVRIDSGPPDRRTIDLGDVAAISLRLVEVQWYRRKIDLVPGGHTAGLKLEGLGFDAIAGALASKQEREFLFIRA